MQHFSRCAHCGPNCHCYTKSKKEKVVSSIGLQLPFVVEVNPNRENIFFESQPRPAAKEEKITVLAPYVQELKAKRSAMQFFMGTWRAVLKAFYISALSWVIISMSHSMQTKWPRTGYSLNIMRNTQNMNKNALWKNLLKGNLSTEFFLLQLHLVLE